MKNILLSVVVISALVVAGVGGTFAHWSDTEMSEDNYLETGSIDLKVNGQDDPPFGIGPGPKIYAEHLAPCKSRDYTIEVENVGQCDSPCRLYMHVKNIECGEVPDKIGQPKPEPEVVAENGGWVNQVWVDGIGPYGENCELAEHIMMTVWYDENNDGVEDPDEVHKQKLDEWDCVDKYLGRLDPCNMRCIYVDVHLQDIQEEEFGFDYFDETDPEVIEKCWNAWPTNALMKDWVSFDILFSLVQIDPPPAP